MGVLNVITEGIVGAVWVPIGILMFISLIALEIIEYLQKGKCRSSVKKLAVPIVLIGYFAFTVFLLLYGWESIENTV